MNRASGFTLIELVVALGIFAVLSVMAYGGLNSVLDSRRAVEAAMKTTADMQRTYLRLRNDFQQLSTRPSRNGYGQSDPALLTTSDGRVEFTHSGWSNPLLQPRATLERVSYRVDDQHRLLRESWRVLDRSQDSTPVAVVLLDDVTEIAWRFLDPASQWQQQWPALSNTALPTASPPPPRAVEVTLQTKAWGELKFLFKVNSSPLPTTAGGPATPTSPAAPASGGSLTTGIGAGGQPGGNNTGGTPRGTNGN